MSLQTFSVFHLAFNSNSPIHRQYDGPTLTTLPSSSQPTRLSASSIDTDSSCLWLATERSPDSDSEEVELTIWRQSTAVEDDLDGNGAPIEQVCCLNTQRAAGEASQVVSLHALPDVRNLVLVARGGDIATLSLGSLRQ